MSVRILVGDVREKLRELDDESVHCVVTSPPYWGLRDYGVDGQIGLEESPWDFLDTMVAVFREARRVLRSDGTAWVNMGDCYVNDGKWGGATGGNHSQYLHGGETRIGREKRRTGLKPKDLAGMPWRLAFALQADGWWLRSDIIWHKPNPMPESVTDRPTSAHEHIFLLAKSDRYYFDADAVRLPDCGHSSGNGFARVDTKNVGYRLSYGGRGQEEQWQPGKGANIRNVWTIGSEPFRDAHFATFPSSLIKPCIKAGCPEGGMVLDPFGGAGTTGLVADRLKRNAILIELNPAYAEIARRRIDRDAGLFAEVAAE